MRILLTSHPGEGHWRPLAPLAVALAEAGHNVAFAATPLWCAIIKAHGFACFPAGDDDDGRVKPSHEQANDAGDGDPDPAMEVWRSVFAGRRVQSMLPGVLAIGRAWRPDLVVRESSEFSGWLMAERLGIPHVALQVSAWRPHLHGVIASALNGHRARIGLARDPTLSSLHRYLFLSPIPASYRGNEQPFPPTTRLQRFEGFDLRPGDEPPTWLDELGGRPVVYATLGTAYNQQPGLLARLVEAVRQLPVDLILTTGSEIQAQRLKPQPANVRVASYVPQSWLLPRCDVVISHGGFGTVQAALINGLPQVFLPLAADQPDNASFCAAHGLGVEPQQRSVDAIRTAVRSMLNDASYRQRARAWRHAALDLPGSSEVVGWLERLAERPGPA
jgi:UDP:flavonoid glycosyltransferase YjiC (YdhE family)